MQKRCFGPGDSMLEASNLFMCEGGPECTLHDGGGGVPKLANGGPVTRTLFNGVTKPLWEVASRTMPEALLPTVAGATIADGLLED